MTGNLYFFSKSWAKTCIISDNMVIFFTSDHVLLVTCKSFHETTFQYVNICVIMQIILQVDNDFLFRTGKL